MFDQIQTCFTVSVGQVVCVCVVGVVRTWCVVGSCGLNVFVMVVAYGRWPLCKGCWNVNIAKLGYIEVLSVEMA